MDHSGMSSAEQFADGNGAFWRNIAPMLEPLIRSANLGPIRFAPPLEGTAPPQRAALVAEAAFSMFGDSITSVQRATTNRIETQARRRIAVLVGTPLGHVSGLTPAEWSEATTLSLRLTEYANDLKESSDAEALVSPILPGCGIVEQAAADFAVGQTLVEVKSVGRAFRGSDIRQVLVYAALDEAAHRVYGWTQVALCNPRQGTTLMWNIDDLCMEVSGRPRSEVLTALVDEMSTGPDYL